MGALLRPIAPAEAAGWADRLIAEFGSLPATLFADAGARGRVLGDRRAVEFLSLVGDTVLHALRVKVVEAPILSTGGALMDYLAVSMSYIRTEELRVLFLDAGNHLLGDEVLGRGSVVEAPIYPREIMRRALELDATALILVHNHPSGDPAPSHADISGTASVVRAARALGITVHDHLIISRSGWTSFCELGLM